MRSTLLFILLTVVGFGFANAQKLLIGSTDQSNYPEIELELLYLNSQSQPEQIPSSMLLLLEDGIQRPIISINCPVNNIETRLSTVLTIDVSGSMQFGNLDMAKIAAQRFVEISDLTKDEIAITSFDHENYLNQDFTQQRDRIVRAINGLNAAGGTDYNVGLNTPVAGALVVAQEAKYKKNVIFLTDGTSTLDLTAALTNALQNNIVVNVINIGMAATPELRELAERTGGDCFENIWGAETLTDLFERIYIKEKEYIPCKVKYESLPVCYEERSLELSIKGTDVKASHSILMNSENVAKLELDHNILNYGTRQPNVPIDTVITLTARNSDFTVNSFSTGSGYFQFQPPSLVIPKGESRQVRVIFTPVSQGAVADQIQVDSDPCPRTIFAYAGKRKGTGYGVDIIVTHPNGGEIFGIKGDTLITWSGTLPDEKVLLEYSPDSGTTWVTITNKATGGEYRWNPLPDQVGNNYLVRARLAEINLSEFSIFSFDAEFGSWNNSTTWYDDTTLVEVNNQYRYFNYYNVNTGIASSIPEIEFSINVKDLAYDPEDNLLFVPGHLTTAPGQKFASFREGVLINEAELSSVNPDLSELHIVHIDIDTEEKSLYMPSQNGDIFKLDYDLNYIKREHFHEGSRLTSHRFEDVRFNKDHGQLVMPTTVYQDNNTTRYSIYFFDSETLEYVNEIVADTLVTDAQYSPSGNYLAASLVDGTVIVHDVPSFTPVYQLDFDSKIYKIEFHPAHDILAIGMYYNENLLTMYDIENRQELFTISMEDINDFQTDGAVWDLDWNPSGNKLAVVDNGKEKRHILSFSNSLDGDTSDSEFTITKAEFAARDIDMGTELLDQTKFKLEQNLVQNNSGWHGTVREAFIKGGDEADFGIQPNQLPTELPPGSTLNLEFTFTPSALGYRESNVGIVSAHGDTITYRIHGNGEKKYLEVIPQLIDFQKVRLGLTKSLTEPLIRNVSGDEITITKIEMFGPDIWQFSSPIVGQSIKLLPDEVLTEEVLFAPIYNGRTSGSLAFHYDGPGSPVIVPLYGEGIGPVVFIGDYRTKPGIKFYANLEVEDENESTISEGSSSFRALIRHEASILASEGTQWNIVDDSTYIEIEGPMSGQGNILSEILFKAGLGRVEETTLEIVEFQLFDSQGNEIEVETETRSGSFILDGICYEGNGAQLVDMDAISNIEVALNNQIMKLEYLPIEKGSYDIELFDLKGKLVYTIDSGHLEIIPPTPIAYSIPIQWESGAYYLRLQTESRTKTKTLLIK